MERYWHDYAVSSADGVQIRCEEYRCRFQELNRPLQLAVHSFELAHARPGYLTGAIGPFMPNYRLYEANPEVGDQCELTL